MKKSLNITAIILLLAISIQGNCQIILSQSDLPKPGDVQVRARIDSIEAINLSPGSSGINITWDFGMLNFFDNSTDKALDSLLWIYPTGDYEAAYFPLAYIAQNTNCYWYHDWSTHIISWKCYHNYYLKDSTGLYSYGSTYPMFHKFQNGRNIFPLLRYGDTLKNTSRQFAPGVIGDTIYVSYVKDTSVADGWGTVYTPIDSYEAIRVYTKETVWDSIYVNGIGQQVKYQTGNYYYKWYAKDFGFPVFQINKGILDNSSDYQIARFFYEKRNNAGVSTIRKNQLDTRIVPNPFSSEAKLIIENNLRQQNYQLIIYDATGAKCIILENINKNEITIKKGNLKNGIYFYELFGDQELISKGKFIIVN